MSGFRLDEATGLPDLPITATRMCCRDGISLSYRCRRSGSSGTFSCNTIPDLSHKNIVFSVVTVLLQLNCNRKYSLLCNNCVITYQGSVIPPVMNVITSVVVIITPQCTVITLPGTVITSIARIITYQVHGNNL